MAASTQNEQLLSKISVFAILSRVALLLIQVVFNAIIPDHDAGVFYPPEESHAHSFMHTLMDAIFGGLRKWDAVYLTHIAEHGYTYENTLAFFPAYPLLLRILSNSIFHPLKFILTYGQVILLTGVVVNMVLFWQCAKCVFRLGRIVIKNDAIAYKAALLFCINPASIFMSAPYTEVLFFYLSLRGIICLETGKKFYASIFFGLSIATRSNGVLNVGYLVYKLCHELHSDFKRMRKGMMHSAMTMFSTLWIFVMFRVIPWCVCILTSLTPFGLYQYYCYVMYCKRDYTLNISEHIVEYGRLKRLKVFGDEPSSWCQDTVPLAYSYVQKHYWSQGFLQYYTWIQIPNFLLAIPVTLLVIHTSRTFFKNNRYLCLTLGLSDAENITKQKKELPETAHYQLRGSTVLPYVVHAAAFTLFGWLFLHIQTLTRLLFSANPVLLWSAAHLITKDTPAQQQFNKYTIDQPDAQPIESADNIHPWTNLLTNQIASFKSQDYTTKLVLRWFLGYCVIGTLMFCNYLPWT